MGVVTGISLILTAQVHALWQFYLSYSVSLINPDVAMVAGPLSFQGEYFHVFTDADEVGDPQFWGWFTFLVSNFNS